MRYNYDKDLDILSVDYPDYTISIQINRSGYFVGDIDFLDNPYSWGYILNFTVYEPTTKHCPDLEEINHIDTSDFIFEIGIDDYVNSNTWKILKPQVRSLLVDYINLKVRSLI